MITIHYAVVPNPLDTLKTLLNVEVMIQWNMIKVE